MQSNTTVSLKVYLMAILDNYMFRPLLAIFRLSLENLTSAPTMYIEREGQYVEISAPRSRSMYIVGP